MLGVALSAVPDVVNGYTGYMNVLGTIFAPMAWLPTAVTPVITGIGHYATVRLLSARFPTLARAGRPGEQRESVDELDQELVLRRSPGPIREAY